MTRLSSLQVAGMREKLTAYDEELISKTGLTLRQIAARAAGVSDDEVRRAFESDLAAVIPVTAGKGIIQGFAPAVAGIIEHLGCPCIVTSGTDVTGLAEGIERGADILFLADDNRFVAIKKSENLVVDNAEATAWAYACALDSLVGGLQGRDVLLIGAGEVGENALRALAHLGATVGVFDIDTQKAKRAAARFERKLEPDLASALNRYTIFFDASPAPAFILREHIKPETAVAACGIPLGLSEEARALIKDRLIHDPLQLGTAAMLSRAVAHRNKNMHGGRIGRIA